MNLVLLGIGLAAGLAVIIAGLVVLFGKKMALPGICLTLAGIALIFGMLMLDTKYTYEKRYASNTSEPVALATETPGTEKTAAPETTPDPETTPSVTPEQTVPAGTEEAATPVETPRPTNTPEPTPTVEPGKYIEVHYDASTVVKPSNWNGSTIYLTFDDGPSFVTGEVLDALKKYNVKATFFVVGKELTDDTRQYVKRAIDEGHSVGIHCNSHVYSDIYTSDEAFLNDFNTIESRLRSELNYRALIFRFPGGASNQRSADYSVGIMSRLTVKMVELGYSYFDWNISPEDAMEIIDPDIIAKSVIDNCHSDWKYNVVLMHDFDTMSNTATALSKIIETCLERGFAFDRLTPETTPIRHKVFN